MFPLKDYNNAHIFPVWVILIIVINVYVFFLEIVSPNSDALIASYALIPTLVDFTRVETLLPFVTAQFLHGGFLHIISNMWFLWVFGKNMEAKLGFFFPLFYLLAGVLGNLTQYLISADSRLPIIGASGAIAGVLGAYYALFPKHKIKTLIFILFVWVVDIPASFLMFYWFITQLFSSAASVSPTAAQNLGGVAYFAHVGGFAMGWLVGKTIRT